MCFAEEKSGTTVCVVHGSEGLRAAITTAGDRPLTWPSHHHNCPTPA